MRDEKLDGDLGALTVADVNALADALHWFDRPTTRGKCQAGSCFSPRPGPLLQFTAVLAQSDVNDPALRDHPGNATVQRACANLGRDFRVGVAEAMDSFIVLAALDAGWPLESVCLESFHVNKDRPRGASMRERLRPEVLAHLRRLLAPDLAVYACAQRQHAAHMASHGTAVHARALGAYQSAAFRAACARRYREYKVVLAARRAEDRKKGRAKFKGEGHWVDAEGKSIGGDSGAGGEEVPFGSTSRCVLSKSEWR